MSEHVDRTSNLPEDFDSQVDAVLEMHQQVKEVIEMLVFQLWRAAPEIICLQEQTSNLLGFVVSKPVTDEDMAKRAIREIELEESIKLLSRIRQIRKLK